MIASVLIICVTFLISLIIVMKYKRKCNHKWNMVNEIKIYDNFRKNDPNCLPVRRRYMMQCTKCGAIKHYEA